MRGCILKTGDVDGLLNHLNSTIKLTMELEEGSFPFLDIRVTRLNLTLLFTAKGHTQYTHVKRGTVRCLS